MVIKIAKDISLIFTKKAIEDLLYYDLTSTQYQQFLDELANPSGTVGDAISELLSFPLILSIVQPPLTHEPI